MIIIIYHKILQNVIEKNNSFVCSSANLINMRLQKPTSSTCLVLHSAFKKRCQSKDDETKAEKAEQNRAN